MNIKRELIVGTFSIILLIFGIGYIVTQYPTTTSNPSFAISQKLTLTDVQKHNTPEDCWIVIEKKIYAVSSYLSAHPGGRNAIIPYCGKNDATEAFLTKGGRGEHSQRAFNLLDTFFVGAIP
jgi:cytochrome b involved in lipid metabolism